MAEPLNIGGAQYGRLTVLELADDYVSPSGNRQRRWLCQCACGSRIVVKLDNLHSGRTRSCGCLRRETTADNNANKILELPSYDTMHARVSRLRGKAADFSCVDCGATAKEWSYDHKGDRDCISAHRFLRGKLIPVTYSVDINRYEPRCATCHRSFDRRPGSKQSVHSEGDRP